MIATGIVSAGTLVSLCSIFGYILVLLGLLQLLNVNLAHCSSAVP